MLLGGAFVPVLVVCSKKFLVISIFLCYTVFKAMISLAGLYTWYGYFAANAVSLKVLIFLCEILLLNPQEK